jgi:hypothetical protein
VAPAPASLDLRSAPDIVVGREDYVRPEPGPLALYLSVFPERTVRWHARRQCFEITQHNPVTGADERVELVDEIVEQTDPETGRRFMARVYRPFDYPFVRQRLRDWYDLRSQGTTQRTAARARRNDRLAERRVRSVGGEMAQGFKEIRRWIPALISGHAHDRVPLVRGGLTRTQTRTPCRS